MVGLAPVTSLTVLFGMSAVSSFAIVLGRVIISIVFGSLRRWLSLIRRPADRTDNNHWRLSSLIVFFKQLLSWI